MNKYIVIIVSTVFVFFSSALQAAALQLSVFENNARAFSGTVDIALIDANKVVTTFNNTSVVPVPAAVWLFSSGFVALLGLARRKY